MKASFKVTDEGQPAIVLAPESGEDTVLLTVFSAQCKAEGWRIAGCDHQSRGGAVDEVTLFPARSEDVAAATQKKSK